MGRRWVVGIVLIGLLASCTGGNDRTDSTERSTTTDDDEHDEDGDEEGHVPVTIDGNSIANDDPDQPAPIGLRLSEGHAAQDSGQTPAPVDGTPLTSEEIQAMLDRLPAWSVPADDVAQFARPAETLRPPLVGDTIDTPFPPPATPGPLPDTDAGVLHVVRFQPEGEVDVAPFLTVTFDQ